MRNQLTAALMLFASVAVVALPVSAQDEPPTCRCVDDAGNEIENCACFRAPRMDGIPGLAFFGDRRARLGISVDVSDDADGRGARVIDVLEDGPAADAGIREGDIITHVDGRSLSEPIGAEAEREFDLDGSVPAQRLLALARELEPGESVEVAFIRDGRQQTAVLEAEDLSRGWAGRMDVRGPRFDTEALRRSLEAMGEGPRVWSFRGDPEGEVIFHRDGPEGDVRVFGPGGRVRAFAGRGDMMSGLLGGGMAAGLELVEVSPELGEYFGADEGVLVTDVRPESISGLEAGDVVLSVDGREVTSPRQLRRILGSYSADEDATIRILRHGEERTLTAPMRRP